MTRLPVFFFSSHRPHAVHAWHREFATAWPESAWSYSKEPFHLFFFFLKQNPLKMDLHLLSMKSDAGWPDVSRSVWRHISHCHCGPLWLALWFYLRINNCCRQADWWSAGVCVCRGGVEWPLGCAGTKLCEWLKKTMCTPTELVIGTQTVKTSRPALKYERATSETSAAKKEFSRGIYSITPRVSKGRFAFKPTLD